MTEQHGHTPGPWEVLNGCNVFAPAIHAPLTSFSYIAVTGGLSGSDTIERDAANARLIAAAPELLAALDGLSSYWDVALIGWDDLPYPEVFRKRVDAARAAIARATGTAADVALVAEAGA